MQVTKTVKDAYDIESQSGTDFCTKGIEKETANIRIAFEKLDGVTPDEMREGKFRPGYEHVNVHMIFNTNMDGKFTMRARLVAEGHTTSPSSLITY